MADQAIYAPMIVLDANGLPVPGARAYFYASGTNTLVSVYADEAETTLATNPVVADGAGYLPQRFVTGAAKVVIQTADGETIRTLDPVAKSVTTTSAAGNISFSPTSNVPQLNVQDAIEAVDTTARGLVAALGDLAALDTITTAQVAASTLVVASEGINANNNDTTLPTSAAVKAYVDTPAYTSADQSITLNSKVDLAHGLGARPGRVRLVVKCIMAEAPYSAGDEIENPGVHTGSGSAFGVSLTCDTTNIEIRTGSGIFWMDDSGALFTPTLTSWRYSVRAWR